MWKIVFLISLASVVLFSSADTTTTRSVEDLQLIQICPDNEWYEYPPYRFHNETETCYRIKQQGGCGELMKFKEDYENMGYGKCVCLNRCHAYWPQNNRCYKTEGQGPCKITEWLVFSKDRKPTCELKPCSDEEKSNPAGPGYVWKIYEGKCSIEPGCYTHRQTSGGLLISCATGAVDDGNGNCKPPVEIAADMD